MGTTPIPDDDFAEQIATRLRELRPSFDVEPTGPRELLVNGRRLDLENLCRMIAHEPGRSDAIVNHFLMQLFAGDAIDLNDVELDFARPRIMPRIQPRSIFEHLSRDLVAHVPFVNGTVVVFVIDTPHLTVSITTEQMLRWGVDTEDLEDFARENLARTRPPMAAEVIASREGGKAAVIAEQDGYDAARLLDEALYAELAPQLGTTFYVGIPARDMLVALSNGPASFVERLRRRILEDYSHMPYPITPELFLVTPDGVAGSVDHRDLGLAA